MMPMFQVSAADKALHGSFLDLEPSEVQEFFQSKYWGAYYCAHYGAPALSDGGSITLFSGLKFHAFSPPIHNSFSQSNRKPFILLLSPQCSC